MSQPNSQSLPCFNMTNYCVFLACISCIPFVANQSPIVQQSKVSQRWCYKSRDVQGTVRLTLEEALWVTLLNPSRKVVPCGGQPVLGAVQRESYDYQTFFANRIEEIQRSTRTQDWWWILGPQNTADIITRWNR